MADSLIQAQARVAIFSWLDQKLLDRPWLTWDELRQGCPTQLGLIPLAVTRGIWNPSQFNETLTIITSKSGPYSDEWVDDVVIKYSYEGSRGTRGNNSKLRLAMEATTPIIVLQKLGTSIYLPRYPAYVVADDPTHRIFTIDLESTVSLSPSEDAEGKLNREYKERMVKARLHQPRFRAQVLRAYKETCAICRLRHIELLDAAHILPDSHPDGIAAVKNGIALCKIHHSAYDKNLMGISPDYFVRIPKRLLLESDGPMLKHGLQAMNNVQLVVPNNSKLHPSKENLAKRFELFIFSNGE